MHDAPRLRGGPVARLVALFAGLAIFAAGIVALVQSGLGAPPWDVLHLGIAAHSPLSLGVSVIVVGLAVLVVAWLMGLPQGFGTVANAIVIGLTVDALLRWRWVQDLIGLPLAGRAGLVVVGIALFGVGSAFYIGAGFGAGPRDSLMLGLSLRTGWRIGLVRAVLEVSVLVIGLALGGTAGVGTLAMALSVGPVVEASFWVLVRLDLAEPGPGAGRVTPASPAA